MVQHQGHHVFGGPKPQHLGAHGEFRAQVEGAALGAGDPRGQLVLGAVRDDEGRLGLPWRRDPLVRLAVLLQEAGPQRLMTLRHVTEGGPQRVEIQ